MCKRSNEYAVDDSWTSFNKYPRQVADVNGDTPKGCAFGNRRADIIGFAAGATFVSLGQKTNTKTSSDSLMALESDDLIFSQRIDIKQSKFNSARADILESLGVSTPLRIAELNEESANILTSNSIDIFNNQAGQSLG